ncbi:glycosyltransferase [Mesorhizobium denitrificans]|uniref:Glycosyltransferase n=2 Tax=Phyllobacteriaceae TaxID=69277 RepID=A0A371X948_9HYPH|nr:glycosyltransferase [Mesorhizobium denitrificans]
MANYRGARFLEESMCSVLAQSVKNLELIVSDDGSDDTSVEIAKRIAREDKRVRVLTGAGNTGPAATRNRALAIARGEWVAIVDSDDLMQRDRLELLIKLADAHACNIVADDLTYFGDDETPAGRTLLRTAARTVPQFVSADLLVQTEIQGSGLPKLGYLKPLIRRSALDGMKYNEALRVGEDFDLLLRLLLKGKKLLVTQESYYQYRRHSNSISHRLSEEKVFAMIAAQRALEGGDIPAATRKALHRRLKALENLLAYERLVVLIKQRNISGATRSLIKHPALLKDLLQSVAENLARRMRPAST